MKGNGLCVVLLSSLLGFGTSTLLFNGFSSTLGVFGLLSLSMSFVGLVVCILRRKSELKGVAANCDDSSLSNGVLFDGIEMLQRFSKKVGNLTRQRDDARRCYQDSEKNRQFAEQILEAVLNNHQIAALLIDRKGKLIEVNNNALKIVGFRRESVINHSVDILTCFPFLSDIYRRNWLAELSANGPGIFDRSHEGVILSHNGGISIQCDWEMTKITLDDQLMYLVFIQPVTRQVVKKRFTLVKPSYSANGRRRPPAQSL
ncbi:PAS domain S-box protein [Marinomonas balearica]|uniref:PAS domain S-box-containing protein n=1 Tax=Marinomonas balearica TaxID=491947 RepID=A0A4R6MGM5_9GAMM|nr:PAS domain-containing protein [Marinomonas balearica]TDO99950.1 PAS domain S-box-containing protein [Marinomonas balearica]